MNAFERIKSKIKTEMLSVFVTLLEICYQAYGNVWTSAVDKLSLWSWQCDLCTDRGNPVCTYRMILPGLSSWRLLRFFLEWFSTLANDGFHLSTHPLTLPCSCISARLVMFPQFWKYFRKSPALMTFCLCFVSVVSWKPHSESYQFFSAIVLLQ